MPRADCAVILDGWELIDLLSDGPLAQVYRARRGNDRDNPSAAFAVKVLRAVWQNEPAAVELLKREAAAARSLTHPNVVPLLAAQLDTAPLYLVTPYLEGLSAAMRLRTLGPFPAPMAFWIARQTALALAALHDAGWMHADVKPGNLIVAASGHTTLIDLGSARRFEELRGSSRWPELGTPNYCAPEAFCSVLKLSAASDLYSLGVTLFELLTGMLPLKAGNLSDFRRIVTSDAPPAIRTLLPHLPPEADELLSRLLAKDPLRRPSHASEIVDPLARLEIETLDWRCGLRPEHDD